jgi:phage head maturation protease
MDPEVDISEQVDTGQINALHTRAASFSPSSVDDSARTVELVWTTGAAVRRYDWHADAYYEEVLEVSPEAIRMDRLASGAPLLLDHYASTSQQVGVVESARIENGQGFATVRFSKRKEVEGVWQDVKDGIIRSVSVGYKVHRYEKEKGDDGTRTYRAVDWEPLEISLVPVPADAGAGVRSEGAAEPATAAHAAQKKERSMDPEQTPAAPVATVDENAIRAAAAAAERARASEIRSAVRSVGLGDDVADRLIDSGTAIDSARSEILSAVAARQSQTDIRSSGVQIVRDEVDTRREAIEGAMLHRGGIVSELPAASREYRGLTLIETARELLQSRGVSTRGKSGSDVVDMALSRSGLHSTGDFPAILANVANKSLRSGYEAAPQTFRPIVREVELSDFKMVDRVQIGDAPKLLKVAEGGEFKRGTVGEAKESYKLETFGRVVGVTRQTIINDDLGAFTRIPELFGREAADLESDLVWGIFNENVAMSDGIALFHADHGNLGAGAEISVDSLAAAEEAMLEQTSAQGRKLAIRPQFLIVRPRRKVRAQQVLGAITANKAGDVNPFQGQLQMLVEPRLAGDAWFLAASPSQIDTIELAYLSGARGLQTFTREGFDIDGVEIKVRMDVAAKAVDHRGFFKNAGN